ncbi:MAG: VOC family protein [Vulcanimicrobiaceae bacterium]
MIGGIHAILYSKHPESVRSFLGEILELPSVDAGEGWPIFAAPPTELAVHPTEGEPEHELYLMCADVHAVVAKLAAKGVETTIPISEQDWGLVTSLRLPGGDEIGLYQPKHPSPIRAANASVPKEEPEPRATC